MLMDILWARQPEFSTSSRPIRLVLTWREYQYKNSSTRCPLALRLVFWPALQKLSKLVHCQPCLPDDRAKRPFVQDRVDWYDHAG
jgi:hypothetical protein